jgi:hypothetical protein
MAEVQGHSFVPSSWSPGAYGMTFRALGPPAGDGHVAVDHRYPRASSEPRDPSPPPPPRPLLDPLQIPWYHPHITRNLAEAELQKAEEGVYLMRPRGRSMKGFAIDVRTTHTVKHFQVDVNPGGLWSFGQETFTTIPAFLEHFDNRPLLGDEGGKLIVLKYPYPREVEENPDYHSPVTAHFLADPPRDQRRHVKRCQSDSDLLSNHSSSGEPSLSSSLEDPAVPKETPLSIHSVSVSPVTELYIILNPQMFFWCMLTACIQGWIPRKNGG